MYLDVAHRLLRGLLQIDIHYSLPKDDGNPNRKVDKDRNQVSKKRSNTTSQADTYTETLGSFHQGTLRIVLQDSRVPIQEFELDHMFRGFGAIKGMYHSGGDPTK